MNEIPLLQPGGERTMLSASLANQLIAVANAVRNMRGLNGIKVTVSDGGIVVESTGAVTPPTDPGGGGGTPGPSLAFRGDWSAGISYAIGDVVLYRHDPTQNLAAGTYIALLANSATAPVNGGSVTWGEMSQGSWDKYLWKAGTNEVLLDVSTTTPLLRVTGIADGGSCVIDTAHLNGKVAQFRLAEVIEAGVCKKSYVMMTETFL
jgi:hypothetical protein